MNEISLRRFHFMRNALVFFLLVPLIALNMACEPTPAVQYNLTVASTEGGSVTTPGEGTFTYEAGTEVELVASPSEGYRFVSWTGDVGTVAGVNSTPTTITINDHYSITALFEMSNDTISEPPPPPEWNPQKQALLPDREFDTNWTVVENWYPALNRGISAIWTSWGSLPSMITSPDDANPSTMLGLSTGQPPGDGPRILRYIFAKNLPGGVPLDLIVRLYDGDTLLEEWVEENIPAMWTTREHELSAEPHTWDDLQVELIRQGDTTAPESDLRHIYVSLVELEIPYPENFIYPYLNPATTTHAPGSDTVQRPPGGQEGDLIFVSSFNGEAAEGFNLIYSQPSIDDAPQPYHLRTWWKRAGSGEPESYTFPNAEGLWAARISGAHDSQITAAGHVEPPPDGFTSPLGIYTPSVDAPAENSLVIRISANSGYITWTKPHQWVAWDEWPCTAASWRFQKEAGLTGEEYHGTGSFIHWVAQTVVFGPK
jgi:hypothetical protein